MANETLKSDIAGLVSLATAEARLTIQNVGNLVDTISRYDLQLGQGSINVPKISAGTAAALTEGSAATRSKMAATTVNLAPTTNAAISVPITDISMGASSQNAALLQGRRAANAVMAKWNADIFALGAGFSTVKGTSGTAISVDLLETAVYAARGAGALGDLFFAAPFSVIKTLLADARSLDNGSVDQAVIGQIWAGLMPNLFGARIMPVYGPAVDANGDFSCPLYSSEAIAIAFAMDPLYGGVWDVRLEESREGAAATTLLTTTSCYAVAEVDDSQGISVLVKG